MATYSQRLAVLESARTGKPAKIDFQHYRDLETVTDANVLALYEAQVRPLAVIAMLAKRDLADVKNIILRNAGSFSNQGTRSH